MSNAVLERLAVSLNWKDRFEAAMDPTVPRHVWEMLLRDEEPAVRAAAHCNPVFASNADRHTLAAKTTDEGILILLARDVFDGVRHEVAKNVACPESTLTKLACDRSNYVRSGVAQNPACPTELLIRFSRDSSGLVLAALARNPSCPEEILLSLAPRGSARIRVGAAANPACPSHVLADLLHDSSFAVRRMALRNANTPSHLADDAIDIIANSQGNIDCSNGPLPPMLTRITLPGACRYAQRAGIRHRRAITGWRRWKRIYLPQICGIVIRTGDLAEFLKKYKAARGVNLNLHDVITTGHATTPGGK